LERFTNKTNQDKYKLKIAVYSTSRGNLFPKKEESKPQHRSIKGREIEKR